MAWKFYTSDGAEKQTDIGSDAVDKATLTTKGDIYAATAASTPARLGVGANTTVLTANSAEATGLEWVAAGAPGAHKDTHDPNDGSDPLDCEAAAEISAVVAASEGAAHTFARADHVHAISHAITDNHILTVDGDPADDEFARFTADGVEGLSVAEAITALLGAALPENVSVRLDPALSADTKWSGITRDGTAGTTGLVYGYCYYLAVATGKWEKTNATAAATSLGEVGMCVGAAAADATGTLLMYGMIRADDEFPAFTVGAPVFLSAATAGILSSTAPTGTTDFVVRPIGSAPTADSLFFKGGDAYATLV